MENEKQEEKISLEEAQKLFADEQAEAEKEYLAARKYIKLADNEQIDFWLTGILTTSEVSFAKDESKTMFQYQLRELTPKGEHKVFSISARQKANSELLKALKEKKYHISIRRRGMASETEYMIMASVT